MVNGVGDVTTEDESRDIAANLLEFTTTQLARFRGSYPTDFTRHEGHFLIYSKRSILTFLVLLSRITY
jgi:hypothetical protein